VERATDLPGVLHEHADRDQDYLTLDELAEAHGRCGALAHAANPFAKAINYPFYHEIFPLWLTKVANLLSNHKVHLVGDTAGYWIFHMHEPARGEEIGYYRFELKNPD
jgi:hypothetical protein